VLCFTGHQQRKIFLRGGQTSLLYWPALMRGRHPVRVPRFGFATKHPGWARCRASMKKLDGKTALITGASKGLGKAMAFALAEQGAKICLVSRDKAKLDAVADEIRARGGVAKVFEADVTDEAQVKRMHREIAADIGNYKS
jgi:hypothetical protein